MLVHAALSVQLRVLHRLGLDGAPARDAIGGSGAVAVTSFIAQPSALDVNTSIGPITVPLTVRNHTCVTGNPEFTDYPATFLMDGATGSTSLLPSVALGQAQFTPASTQVELTNPRLTTGFSCGIVQFICDFLVDTISPIIETGLEAALSDALETSLPTEFEEIADSAGAPPVVASPTRLGVEASVSAPLGSLRSVGGGLAGLQIGLATQVFPSSRAAGIPTTLPGSIRRGGSIPAFLPNPLGIALRDDHVNQALWYAGAFDVQDLSADGVTHGLPAQSLSAFAQLPPVLMAGAVANDVEIGLGDLRIDARLDLAQVLGPPAQGVVDVSALASARVLGSPSVDAARQKLGLQRRRDLGRAREPRTANSIDGAAGALQRRRERRLQLGGFGDPEPGAADAAHRIRCAGVRPGESVVVLRSA